MLTLVQALRALTNQVAGLKEHEFDVDQGRMHNINILPMDLEKESNFSPTFFTTCPASLLLNPDDSYDRTAPPGFNEFDPNDTVFSQPIDCGRRMLDYFVHYTCNCASYSGDEVLEGLWSPISIGDKPFYSAGLGHHTFPEFVTIYVDQVKEGPYPHLKAMMRTRFLDHMIAPVLLFSFMGPQHVRLVETYFDGRSVVARPSRLFDLRKKNEAAMKELGQWYFGKPVGNTKGCP
ncbi:hypothetical protein BDV33DRAFT_231725 [Aspergillus novoparasiticus]|uniref:Uncharacterized protein n=1 Tax=Aspergillus novoparasiticus TaxID=986946 RepID=A0A5N6EQY1_9EURO|nr:hypothetical protein BDV33DRAFT_231725 [Aspergillus novoparasiticus]